MKSQSLQRRGRCAARGAFTPAALATAAALVVGGVLAGCANPGGIASRSSSLDPVSLGLRDGKAEWPSPRWWSDYGDRDLDRLVDRALDNSPTLAVAQARLDRVRAQSGLAESAGGLKINAGADATRQRFPAYGLVPPPYAGSWQWVDNAQITGRYEFDFWGRTRSAISAALGREFAARAESASARLTLAAAVTRAWFGLAALLEAREVANLNLKQRKESFHLVQQRVSAGLDDRVTLKQAESAVPAARQQLAAVDERIELSRNALAALTATPRADPAIAKAAPKLPRTVRGQSGRVDPDQLPLDLLARRPDVIASRNRVMAGYRDIDAAKADFYPNVSITGLAGLNSVGLSRLLRGDSRVFGIGPAVNLPIFDNGRLRSALRATHADFDQAVATYNQTLIDAIHDVSDQVVSLKYLDRQMAEQRSAQREAETAYDLARQRYRAGLSPYLTVLTAESAVIDQRRVATELRARSLDLDVQLQRALGGGYEAGQDDPGRSMSGPATAQGPTRDPEAPSGRNATASAASATIPSNPAAATRSGQHP